jgi:hypothetical protein
MPSSVRWFASAELSIQAHRNWEAVKDLILDPSAEDCPATRTCLKNLLADPTTEFELNIVADVGTQLTKACHFLEGDTLIAPVAYDLWHQLLSYLRELSDVNTPAERLRILLPNVALVAEDADDEETFTLQDAQRKIKPVFDKMLSDTSGRMALSLSVLLCRLADCSATDLSEACLLVRFSKSYSA